MKIAYQQLEQHLSKTIAPIYVVSGDELLLVQEAIDLIRARATRAGFSERMRIQTDSDWGASLYANAHSLSLFAEKKILELDLRGVKLNQANSEILQNYAEKPAENTLLLIQTNKLDAKSETTKWFKALDKAGATIPVWPITGEQLPQWIMQRAKKSNLTLSSQAATWLAEQVEGNLLAASQEIEKLSLLQGENWDARTLDDVISNNARFDIFNLVDSALNGNLKRTHAILKNLCEEDTEPTLVLWAISRELRTMASIISETQQGQPLGSLFGKYRIWDKRQPGARAFLKRNSQQNCCDMLLNAGKIDRIIKGSDAGNVWDELERLALKMAGSAIL